MMQASVKIPNDVREVLQRGRIEDGRFILPEGRLDAALYRAVDKVLRDHGARWYRGSGSHHFATNGAGDEFMIAVQTGVYANPKLDGFFSTPPAIAHQLVNLAEIERGQAVLDPSAGTGALLYAASLQVDVADLWGFEIDPGRAEQCRACGLRVTTADFLAVEPLVPAYDRIVMNPPFNGTTWAKHIGHALTFLAEGGRLVSIIPSGSIALRRTTPEVKTVREWAHTVIELPSDAFLSAGVPIKTAVIVIDNA